MNGGRITWTLDADSSAFNSSLAAAEGKAVAAGASINNALDGAGNNMRRTLNSIADSMMTVGRNMSLYVSAPIVAGLGLSVKSASDFQDTLSQLKIISSATSGEMGKFSAVAQELGKDVNLAGVTAANAADAMVELSKAGLSVTDTIGAARGVLTLAKAGQMDFGAAANFTAAALNAFKLSGDKAIFVADTLANGANASQASLHDLALGMQQSSAVSSLFGLSLQDNITALSLFANNGIRASDAGTSLKSMLLAIATPSKRASEVMQEIGFNAYDANGRMLGLREMSLRLADSLKGLNDQQKQTALGTIFGSDAVRAAALLAQNAGPEWDNMAAKIARTGTAADVAAARYGPFRKALEGLRNNISQLGLDIGNILMPPLTSLFKSLTTAVKWFNDLNPSIKTAVVSVLLLVASIGPMILTLALVGKTILAFSKALALAKVALVATKIAAVGASGALALTPVGWAVIAIGALVAILVVLQTKFGVITKALKLMQPAWNILTSALKETWNTIKTAMLPAWNALSTALKPFAPVLKYIAIGLGLLLFWPVVKFLALLTAGMWVLGKVLHLLQPAIKFVAELFADLVQVYVRVGKAIYDHTIGPLVDLARKFDVVGKVVEGFQKIMRGITAVFDDPKAAIIRFAKDIEYYFGRLVDNAPKWGADILKKFAEGIANVAGNVADVGVKIYQKVREGFLEAVDDAKNWIVNIANKVAEGIGNIPENLKEAGGKMINLVKQGWDDARRNAPQWGENVVNAVKDAAMAMVKYNIDSVIDWKNGLESAYNNAKEMIKNIGKGITEGWADAKQWGKDTIKNIGDGIVEAYQSAFDWGRDLIKKVGEGITDAFTDIKQFGKDLPTKIKEGLTEGYEDLKEGGKSIITGIVDGLKDGVAGIVQWFKDLPTTLKKDIFDAGAKSGEEQGKGFMDYWGNQSNMAKIGQKILLGLVIAVLAIPAAIILLTVTIGVAIINGIIAGLQFAFDQAGGLAEWLLGLGGKVINTIGDALSWLWQKGVDIITGLVGGIGSVASTVWDAISGAASNIGKFFVGAANWLWETGISIVRGLAGGISGVAGEVWNAIKTVGDKIGAFFVGAAGWLWGVGKAIVMGLVGGLKNDPNAAWNGIKFVADKIGQFFSGAGNWLWDSGKAIINGLVNGIKSGFNSVKDTLGDLTNKIKSWKGPMSLDKVLLVDNADAIMGGLVKGLESNYGTVRNSLSRFTDSLSGSATIGLSTPDVSPVTGDAVIGGAGYNSSQPTRIENHIGTINIADEVDAENWLQKLTRQDEVTSTGLTY